MSLATETLDDTRRDPAVFVLTVAHHPRRACWGERAVLRDEREHLLGRDATLFTHDALDEPALSRQHAVLTLRGDRLTVEDRGSSNGTWVNGERVARVSLGTGDVLRLGRLVVTVRRTTAHRERPLGCPDHAQSEPMLRLAASLAEAAPSACYLLLGPRGAEVGSVAEAVALRHDAAPTVRFHRPEHPAAWQGAPRCVGPIDADNADAVLKHWPRAAPSLEAPTLLWWPRLDAEPLEVTTARAQLVRRLAPRVLEIPPLRERFEDLLALADGLSQRDHGVPLSITPALAVAMLRAPWRGDIDALDQFVRHHLAPTGAPLGWNEAFIEALGLAIDDAHRGTPSQRSDRDESPRIVIDPEAKVILREGSEPVRVEARPTVQRLLKALLDAPEGLSTQELLARAWPGQRLVGDSGAHRVHVAINTLRAMGLRDALLRDEQGYRIDRRNLTIAAA
ncbi:MAG: FHA domain-containing protein [Myxococcales bacterium]|nr:FHA domain-containing protein [Myxococcales bacterium]